MRDSISVKHQFFYPAVISVIINLQTLSIIKSGDLVKNRHVLHVQWRQVKSFALDCMIRGYHVYKDVLFNFIGEVLYCRRESRDVHNHHDPMVSLGQTSFSAGVIDSYALMMCKGMTAVDKCLRKHLFCGSLASATAFKTSMFASVIDTVCTWSDKCSLARPDSFFLKEKRQSGHVRL